MDDSVGPGTDDTTSSDRRWAGDAGDSQQEAVAVAVDTGDDDSIDPGDPSLENALFVVLGALFALFVLSRLFVG